MLLLKQLVLFELLLGNGDQLLLLLFLLLGRIGSSSKRELKLAELFGGGGVG